MSLGVCSCNFSGLGVWGIDLVMNRGGMVLDFILWCALVEQFAALCLYVTAPLGHIMEAFSRVDFQFL
eukprot:6364103-Amphidinium_carterae.1